MDKDKKEKLEAAGWKVGSTEDFLGLSNEKMRYIDTKISLSRLLKKARNKRGVTQDELADHLDTSQARIAVLEKGESGVSIDAIIRALYALNVNQEEINRAFKNSNDPELI